MKVSILITNYNYAKYLKDCIESCLNQSYHNFEIILFDDQSTDNSMEIALRYTKNIKIINDKNAKKSPYVSYNQNNGLYQAFLASDGDIICLLDSDDTFAPDKLEKIVKIFQAKKETVMVENSGYYTNKFGEITDYFKCYKPINFIDLYRKRNHTNFHMPTSFLSFRRSYLEQVFQIFLVEKYPFVYADNRLSSIAPFYGTVECTFEPLTYYRIHGENETVINPNGIYGLMHHQNYVNDFLEMTNRKKLKTYKSKLILKQCFKAYASKLKNFFKN